MLTGDGGSVASFDEEWSKANNPQSKILELSHRATASGAALRTESLDRLSPREIELTEDGEQGWVKIPLAVLSGMDGAIGKRLETDYAAYPRKWSG